jgi:hypothetical protein
MLRVTVELIPFGNEVNKETIGVIHIANDGTSNRDKACYDIIEMSPVGPQHGMRKFRAEDVVRISQPLDFLRELFSKAINISR